MKTLFNLVLQFDAWIYADDSISLHVDQQHSYNSHDGADCWGGVGWNKEWEHKESTWEKQPG